jgi:hypothetical protein
MRKIRLSVEDLRVDAFFVTHPPHDRDGTILATRRLTLPECRWESPATTLCANAIKPKAPGTIRVNDRQRMTRREKPVLLPTLHL